MYKVDAKRRSNFRTERSKVDKRLTVHPITGARICGSFKANKRAEFERMGLTIEEVLDNKDIFLELICCRPPAQDTPFNNGRCRFHGANCGHAPTHGKYSDFLATFTDAEKAGIFDQEHTSLNDELSLLRRYIGDKLPESLGENAVALLAKGKLKSKIKSFVESYKAMKIDRCLQIAEELEKLIEDSDTVASAKVEVRQLIKEYSDVFKVEVARRSLSGEYLSKKVVIHSYSMFFQCLSTYIPPQHHEQARRALGKLIVEGDILGLRQYEADTRIAEFEQFINPDQGQEVNTFLLEPGPGAI